MGRNARLKRERRAARAAAAADQRRRIGFVVAPCSHKDCPNRQPPGTHLLYKPDGSHYTACDDCVQGMMRGLKAAGIDCQVVTLAALEHMKANPPQGPAVIPPNKPGFGDRSVRGVGSTRDESSGAIPPPE